MKLLLHFFIAYVTFIPMLKNLINLLFIPPILKIPMLKFSINFFIKNQQD